VLTLLALGACAAVSRTAGGHATDRALPTPASVSAGATTGNDPGEPLGPVVPTRDATGPEVGQDVGGSAAPGQSRGVEVETWVPAGDHRVPGTLTLPRDAAGPVPAVLLLHGDLGDRNSAGDSFARLANALARRGVASLRIDFAGSGESEEPDTELDYASMVQDARAAVTYLQHDPRVRSDKVAVLGFSRGGSIAATLAGTDPSIAALVEWSGAVANGYVDDPDGWEVAKEQGYNVYDLGGGRDFEVMLDWYDSIAASTPLDDVSGYTGPVLSVVGSDDPIVPPEVADTFLSQVASQDKQLITVDGASHDLEADDDDPADFRPTLRQTADWLAEKLR
jgi:dienelactone hydrolase